MSFHIITGNVFLITLFTIFFFNLLTCISKNSPFYINVFHNYDTSFYIDRFLITDSRWHYLFITLFIICKRFLTLQLIEAKHGQVASERSVKIKIKYLLTLTLYILVADAFCNRIRWKSLFYVLWYFPVFDCQNNRNSFSKYLLLASVVFLPLQFHILILALVYSSIPAHFTLH